MHKRINKMFTD